MDGDGLGPLVAAPRRANRADQVLGLPLTLPLPLAMIPLPAFEPGALGGRSDHPHIGRIAPRQGGIGQGKIKPVIMGCDHKCRAAWGIPDNRLWQCGFDGLSGCIDL